MVVTGTLSGLGWSLTVRPMALPTMTRDDDVERLHQRLLRGAYAGGFCAITAATADTLVTRLVQLGTVLRDVVLVAAWWIAIKFEEADTFATELLRELRMSARVTPADLCRAEAEVLTAIGFCVPRVTPIHLIAEHLKRLDPDRPNLLRTYRDELYALLETRLVWIMSPRDWAVVFHHARAGSRIAPAAQLLGAMLPNARIRSRLLPRALKRKRIE